ncbi:MAG: putative hydrolase [Lentisphaerae bacterium ADurb.Bin242]|nr:MAG: putative hydrolase [Lentisphaerae bacterium ADurb.Bin242]
MDMEQLIAAVRERVRELLDNAPGCHDFDHTLRVLRNAELLLEEEPHTEFEKNAVILAALLHDVARPEELTSEGKLCHARLGAEKVPGILRSLGCSDPELVVVVSRAVGCHRYRGKEAPVTLADKIVYDADKLDSIGAVGIGRAFHFAGRIGARLHNTEDAALHSESYSAEDSAYREYLVKLRHIPERLFTESGRRHAAERVEYMHEFFRRMNEGL